MTSTAQPIPSSVRRLVAGHGLAAVGMSLVWPLLLLQVWEETHDGLLLGLAGAARMLPYVVLSWAAGRLADRVDRGRLVRMTVLVRILLLLLAAGFLTAGVTWAALVSATLAVAVATPAYPALAAAMPAAAGPASDRATNLLVTCEVASFVVGPAVGGLLLAPSTRGLVPWLAVALLVLAAVALADVVLPSPAPVGSETARTGVIAILRDSRPLRGAIGAVAAVNAVGATVGLALLPLAEQGWASDGTAFGVATGALGLGALAGPLLGRLAAHRDPGVRTWLVLLAGCLALVVPSPSVAWAVLPLAVAGALAVQVETAATALVQRHAPDAMRATVLGITDTAMVAAALVGALLAPLAAGLTGPRPLVLIAAVGCLVAVACVRRDVTAPTPAPAVEARVPVGS